MPGLPVGTVTFLFTDIEGSTRLWEEDPHAMRLALARHDVLMRSAIEQQDGHVFKTMGDAFCAAFHTALDALHAALDAQQALTSELWPEGVTIKVRMALHTGAAEVRENDYFGQPLNRVARLLAAGHGGQVLLSLATQELARDALPPSVTLQAMGEHRLRDLNRPEMVFQLLHPDLPVDFPPLKTLDYFPNNLPRQLTSFIGREKEIGEIKNLLTKTSLLTLTGSGGCGKTRLTLQVAADVLDQYPDGAWLIELAPLNAPDLVMQEVASALSLTEQPGKTFTQTLIEHLKFKRLLLVLDNCEHLVSACAQLCNALLRACPNLTILASSREGLGIAGEQIYRVPSLSLPDPTQILTIDQLSQYEAVRLFVERAASNKADFAVANASAPALASICHRLDGIPLAIELAAARVRSLSVEEINTRLDNRFHLLTGGSRTALPRQQTLRALIDWSYSLLTDTEALLLCRLSVFVGGWTLAAAEAICSDEQIEDFAVMDLLTSLVDKSLVIADQREGLSRFGLMETIREYAAERLKQTGEEGRWKSKHLQFFLQMAKEASAKGHGSEQAEWLKKLHEEHDNLRAGLTWCSREKHQEEAYLGLANALWRFWYIRGYYTEGREHLQAALSQGDANQRTQVHAQAFRGAGSLAWTQGDFETAWTLFTDGQEISKQLGDKFGRAASLVNLGLISAARQEYESARASFEESLTIFRELGHKAQIAHTLNNLAALMLDQGYFAAARAFQTESLEIYRALDDKWSIARALRNLGDVAHGEGDLAIARARHRESLVMKIELVDKQGIIDSLGSLASLAQTQHEDGRAARLYGAESSLLAAIGSSRAPLSQITYDRRTVEIRSNMGDAAFDAAFAEGHAMTLEEAATYALEELDR